MNVRSWNNAKIVSRSMFGASTPTPAPGLVRFLGDLTPNSPTPKMTLESLDKAINLLQNY